ncbi:hypothetical protein ACU686_26895 [Yinghuangia aomiensis]
MGKLGGEEHQETGGEGEEPDGPHLAGFVRFVELADLVPVGARAGHPRR